MDSDNKYVRRPTRYLAVGFYFLASLALILASLLMIGRSLFDLYTIIVVEHAVTKDIIDSISFAVVAIAVFDVGRYLLEEEVQRRKELSSQSEVRQTLTRFMVATAVALSLEGLVGVFEAAVKQPANLVYPVMVVVAAVLVVLALGVYQRLSVTVEKLEQETDRKKENGVPT
ncbi:MAG: hypothetical protein WBG92_22970 [Thiohalocapsa sp.]